MRYALLFTALWWLCHMTAWAQVEYRIPSATKISISKSPEEGRMAFKLGEVEWSAIANECAVKPNTGASQWFSYTPKQEALTVILRYGKGFGELAQPAIYIGTVVAHNGRNTLQEVACISAASGESELRLGADHLVPKQEYFILITDKSTAKPGRFSLQLTGEYTPPAPAEVAAEATATSNYLLGRIRSKDGKGKSGVTVTLVRSDNLQALESATSAADGSFRFEKLPKDQPVLSRIEEEDSELVVDLYLFDEDGKVLERATRVGDRLYGFGADQNGFPQLRLLTPNDWRLNVSPGKTGVTGRIVDAETFLYGQQNIAVDLYDTDKNKLQATVTDANGRFTFVNLEEQVYLVKVSSNQEKTYTEMVIVDDLNVPLLFANSSMMGSDGFFHFEKLPMELVELHREQEMDTQLKLPTDFSVMEKGNAIVLKSILFESGNAKLLEVSFDELNRLAAELKRRPDVRIEVGGHTDNTGNEAANKQLSEQRAKIVVDYLISLGIASDRLTYKGYGSSQPKASNETNSGRMLNRRVEFVVL